MTPTSEQTAAVEAFGTGGSLVIEAGAGTGKTATLVLIGEATPRRGQYLAFNRAIVADSGARFPENVAARTMHSLAYGAVGKNYRPRMDASRRMRSEDIARALRIDPIEVSTGAGSDKRRLAPGWLAGRVMEAVGRFCQSADEAPGVQHFAYVDGLDMPQADGRKGWTVNREVNRYLAPYLTRAWLDLCQLRGTLRFDHDHYLKLWQLGGPVIPADFILFDEAQDVRPVFRAIVEAQRAQQVWVGDSAQAIYEWTGAVNALEQMMADQRCYLTQSFRFGPAVAEAANAVLEQLETPMRLRGLESIDSTVILPGDAPADVDCVLTRTNACSVRQVLSAMLTGRSVHLVGGGKEVLSFARAAEELQMNGHTSHRELSCFQDWAAVQAYVQADALGGELRLLVQLVDEFGVRQIEKALANMPKELDAEVIVSTAHKAKGREWRRVRLADDFPPPAAETGEIDPSELRLLYVAATRAKNVLDLTACPTLAAIVAGEDADRA